MYLSDVASASSIPAARSLTVRSCEGHQRWPLQSDGTKIAPIRAQANNSSWLPAHRHCCR